MSLGAGGRGKVEGKLLTIMKIKNLKENGIGKLFAWDNLVPRGWQAEL